MRLPAASLILLCLASPVLAQEKADIQKLEDKLAAVLNAGDAAGAAAIYAEDATLMPPDAPVMKGRPAIEQFWKAASGAVQNVRLTTSEARPLGADTVAEIGQWAVTVKGDKPHEAAGKYLILWRKSGSDWRIAVDIWNDGQ